MRGPPRRFYCTQLRERQKSFAPPKRCREILVPFQLLRPNIGPTAGPEDKKASSKRLARTSWNGASRLHLPWNLENSIKINLGHYQIPPVPPRLFHRGRAAPLRHFRVISADQDLRNLPSSEIRRPRVVRKIEKNLITACRLRTRSALSGRSFIPSAADGMLRPSWLRRLCGRWVSGERFILRRRFIPKRPRQKPRDPIHNQRACPSPPPANAIPDHHPS